MILGRYEYIIIYGEIYSNNSFLQSSMEAKVRELVIDWEGLNKELVKTYLSPRHGNPEEPLDCLFYIMLTRKTPISTAKKLFTQIKEEVGSFENILNLKQQKLKTMLFKCGLQSLRAEQFLGSARMIYKQFGQVTLDPIRSWNDEDCIDFLTKLPGVGLKTALCVMMYSLNRKVFPADAHCIRIMKRLGVISEQLDHRKAQKELSRLVPPELSYSLHVNLVAHGQEICHARSPICERCVIENYCKNKKN